MTTGFDEFREHVKLAEDAIETVIDWIEDEESADPDFQPSGPVADAMRAMARLFVMEDQANEGEPIPEKLLERQAKHARDAVAGLGLYPPDVRLCIAAPLAELAESLSLERLIPEILDIVQSPDDQSSPEEPEAVQSAMDRLLGSTVRLMIVTDEWSPDFETILKALRDISRDSTESKDLTETLKRAILFHAWSGRMELVAQRRQKLVDDEPLPDALARALTRMAGTLELTPLVTLSVHLALVDAVAAGLVPKRCNPLVTVASMFLAWASFDSAEVEEDERDEILPGARELARWARCRPGEILALSNELIAVFGSSPEDDVEEETLIRQLDRYYFVRYSFGAMPDRWIPERASQGSQSVSEIVNCRLEELRDVAWLMVDPFEPVRFVLNALPDTLKIDEESIRDLIEQATEIWDEEKYVDVQAWDDDFDDDFFEEFVDGDEPSGLQPMTSDGDRLLFCRRRYRFDGGDLAEISSYLDAVPTARRDDGSRPFAWVFLGGQHGDLVLGTAFASDGTLTLETMSAERDQHLGTLLEDTLGDLVVLVDRDSREPRP